MPAPSPRLFIFRNLENTSGEEVKHLQTACSEYIPGYTPLDSLHVTLADNRLPREHDRSYKAIVDSVSTLLVSKRSTQTMHPLVTEIGFDRADARRTRLLMYLSSQALEDETNDFEKASMRGVHGTNRWVIRPHITIGFVEPDLAINSLLLGIRESSPVTVDLQPVGYSSTRATVESDIGKAIKIRHRRFFK